MGLVTNTQGRDVWWICVEFVSAIHLAPYQGPAPPGGCIIEIPILVDY